jgi:hypothetical protein
MSSTSENCMLLDYWHHSILMPYESKSSQHVTYSSDRQYATDCIGYFLVATPKNWKVCRPTTFAVVSTTFSIMVILVLSDWFCLVTEMLKIFWNSNVV